VFFVFYFGKLILGLETKNNSGIRERKRQWWCHWVGEVLGRRSSPEKGIRGERECCH